MITKQDLDRIRYSERRLKFLNDKIAQLRGDMTSVSVKMDGMPRSGSFRDSMAEFVAKVDDLEREYCTRVLELERLKLRVDGALDALPAQQADIIRMRALQGMTWEQVSAAANYTARQCQRLYKQGMEATMD